MITVGILAKNSNVPIYTVRHYTRIGLLKPSRNPANDYKVYQPSDEVRLRFIVAAKNLGFTLSEIKQILSEAHHGNSPCPTVREIVHRRIKENRRKIKQLKNLQRKMEDAETKWAKMENALPDGDSICHLIEIVAETDSALDLTATHTF